MQEATNFIKEASPVLVSFFVCLTSVFAYLKSRIENKPPDRKKKR